MRQRHIRSAWGKVSVGVQRWYSQADGRYRRELDDPSLDGSGWTPWALERLLDLAARLPFAEAAAVAAGFGLHISTAELERLSQDYAGLLERELNAQLEQRADEALREGVGEQGRVMVLEVDGVRVLGQANDRQHRCEGIEIKSALVYAQASPGSRTRWAGVKEAAASLSLLAGLLRQAEVHVSDSLIGVSDGARWIEELFGTLGIPQVIDVYHASQYLEQVMVQLGWSEEVRLDERQRWLRGEVNAAEWLPSYVPPASLRRSWTAEALQAIGYLEARASKMAYRDFKARGWPIGSGQVEGMNKHVIGSRMKRSGRHWSRPGASRMAALRAHLFSNRSPVAFHSLRRRAFPICRS